MTNIAFALPEKNFLFYKQQEYTYSNCIKYLKLRTVGKTLKIVKCTVRSEPKIKTRTGPAYYASKKRSRRNYLSERLKYQLMKAQKLNSSRFALLDFTVESRSCL